MRWGDGRALRMGRGATGALRMGWGDAEDAEDGVEHRGRRG